MILLKIEILDDARQAAGLIRAWGWCWCSLDLEVRNWWKHFWSLQ